MVIEEVPCVFPRLLPHTVTIAPPPLPSVLPVAGPLVISEKFNTGATASTFLLEVKTPTIKRKKKNIEKIVFVI